MKFLPLKTKKTSIELKPRKRKKRIDNFLITKQKVLDFLSNLWYGCGKKRKEKTNGKNKDNSIWNFNDG